MLRKRKLEPGEAEPTQSASTSADVSGPATTSSKREKTETEDVGTEKVSQELVGKFRHFLPGFLVLC